MGRKERFYVDIMALHPEVTGSNNLLIVKLPNGETIRIVVDCGMFQEKEYTDTESGYKDYNESLPFIAENVDFCLVTHNHIDHTGRLPLMVKKGYKNKIYATIDTCKLLPAALQDSLHIIDDLAKRRNQKPLYKEADVDKAVSLLAPCAFNTTFNLCENVKVTFFVNGHLVGAALILIQLTYPGQEDINLLFTGDYNNKNIFFDVPNLPKWVLDLPITIVQESTYGKTDSDEITPCFRENIKNFLQTGGSVLVPVFSLGRAQQIAYEIKCMQEDGSIPSDLPVYLDGKLAFKYTTMYLNGQLTIKPEMQEFMPKNIVWVDSEIREGLLYDKRSMIILTTSGMGSHGPAKTYIPEYVRRKNALIHFTGYLCEGTMGHKINNAEDGEFVEILGIKAKKFSKVECTSEYSSHAKADEMIDFLNQFSNLRLVLVNHGEKETKEIFSERIVEETDARNVGILGREYLFRVNHYGYVKSMTTKF